MAKQYNAQFQVGRTGGYGSAFQSQIDLSSQSRPGTVTDPRNNLSRSNLNLRNSPSEIMNMSGVPVSKSQMSIGSNTDLKQASFGGFTPSGTNLRGGFTPSDTNLRGGFTPSDTNLRGGFTPSDTNFLAGFNPSDTNLLGGFTPSETNLRGPSATNSQMSLASKSQASLSGNADPRQATSLSNTNSRTNMFGQATKSQSATGQNPDPRQIGYSYTVVAAYGPSRPNAPGEGGNAQGRQDSVFPNLAPPAEQPNPRFRTAGSNIQNPYGQQMSQSQAGFSGSMAGQMSPGPMGSPFSGQMSPGPMGGMSPGPLGQMSPGPMGQPSPGPMGQMSPGPIGGRIPQPNGYGATPADSSNGFANSNNGMSSQNINQMNNGMNGMSSQNLNQMKNGMNGMSSQNVTQMANGMNGMPTQNGNQMTNGMNGLSSQNLNQMNNGMTMPPMNSGFNQDGGMGQPGQNNGPGQRRTSGPQGIQDPNFLMDPNDPLLQRSIHAQIEQIIRSRGNSFDANAATQTQTFNPNPNPNNVDPLVDLGGVLQGICRMDCNGITSDNAQLEKMLNTAIAKAFEKGYQCKEIECQKKKRRRRCPQQEFCPIPVQIPICQPPQRQPTCPTGGSPGNCCDCGGMKVCGKAVKYPPSITNFEKIRPLKTISMLVPGCNLFDKQPSCPNPMPPVPQQSACCSRSMPPPPQQGGCCGRAKSTSACGPPPPCPPRPTQSCGKPTNCCNLKPVLPTCLMLPLHPPAPCPPPRRPKKQPNCKSSNFCQNLLEISAALCDQQCALVKLMSDIRGPCP